MKNRARQKIAKNLETLIDKRKITQRELSLRTGLSEPTISRYLNYASTPTLENVYILSMGLGCRVQDLLEGIEVGDMR